MNFIIIFLLIGGAYNSWTVLFQDFFKNTLTPTDISQWNAMLIDGTHCTITKNASCSGDYSANYMIIRRSCPILQKTISDVPPHYLVRIYVDIYFMGANDYLNNFYIYLDNDELIHKQYQSTDLPDQIFQCTTRWDPGLDIKSYHFDKPHSLNSLTIQFKTDVNDSYETYETRAVSIKNLEILIKQCHATCKTCSGDGQSACLSCYYGVPQANGSCNLCDFNLRFIDIQIGACVQECSRSKLAQNFRVCYSSLSVFQVNDYFSSQFITSYEGWNLILDDVYYQISSGCRSTVCDLINYLGPFYGNEGLELKLNLFATVQQIRFRSTFFFHQWVEHTGIFIFLDDVEMDLLFYVDGNYYSDADSMIVIASSSCTKKIRMELVMRTSNSKAILKIQGNMKNSMGSTWGLRDVYIDQIVCEPNCVSCASLNQCANCAVGYNLHKGKCLLECPIYSTQIGSICRDYDEESPNAQYKIKAFYDTTTQYDELNSIVGTITSSSTDNKHTGQEYGYISGKRVYGGLWTIHDSSAFISITGLEPHFQIFYKITLILGDGLGNFAYTVTNLATQTIYYTYPDENSSDLIGTANLEKWFTSRYYITHDSSNVDITLNYNCQEVSFMDSFAAVANYFLVVYYCAPFCQTCTGPTKIHCTLWQSSIANTDEIWSTTPPLQIIEVRCSANFFFDKSIFPHACTPCGVGCQSCLNKLECTQCQNKFYLSDGWCYCESGYYNSGPNCLLCHSSCKTCFGPNSDQCYYNCYKEQRRLLSHTQCLCEPFYEEVEEDSELVCRSICGDLIITKDEECDDGNNVPFDGCFQCKHQCQLNCESCFFGACYTCQPGFILQEYTHQCVAECGDLIVQSEEQCDSLNSNCQNCAFQCQTECSNCQDGICKACIDGWYLNLFNNKCEAKCGDGIIVEGEDCDDGNLVPHDGCLNCQFSCDFNCAACINGVCSICKIGWALDQINGLCSSIFGDSIIVGFEQCDDGNDIEFDDCNQCHFPYQPVSNVCFNCQFSCDANCKACINGVCSVCKIGWALDQITGSCSSICGDSIIVGFEQCDDGNEIEFDGCYQCEFQCQSACNICLFGKCQECQVGWQVAGSICEPICGDGLIVANEECDKPCQLSCLDCRFGYCFECKSGWTFNEYYCYSNCGDQLVVDGEDCDDGNDIPNDGCHQCKYSCDVNCDLCVEGVCESCKSGFSNQSSNKKCKSICGDGIVQYGFEDCDDGNQIEFDGCYNCTFQCSQFCQTCLEGVCQSCQSEFGYVLRDNECVPICGDGIVIPPEQCDNQNSNCVNCQLQCHEKCLDCQNGSCLKCQTGWYAVHDKCESQCGDGLYVGGNEECDDGNSSNLDGCNFRCITENNYECINSDHQPSVCFYKETPKIELEILSQADDSVFIRFSFNQRMKLQPQFEHITNYIPFLSVSLKEDSDDQNEYEIEAIQQPSSVLSEVEFKIKYVFKQNIINPTLILTIKEDNLISEYNRHLQSLSDSIQVKDPKVISLTQREKAEQISNTNKIIVIVLVTISIISLLTGSIEFFQNILDQLQYLSYIKYINVAFPQNLQIYFDAFSIVSLDPLLQFINFDKLLNLLISNQDTYIEPQPKFAEDGVNAYFLDNILSFLFCLFSGYFSFYFSLVIYKWIQKLKATQIINLNRYFLTVFMVVQQYLKSIVSEFYYFGILEIFLTNYYDISFATLIQLTNFNFENINFAINSVSSVLILFVQIILTYKILIQTIKLISTSQFYHSMFKKKSISIARSQYDNDNLLLGINSRTLKFWSLQHNIVILLKKFLFMMAIVLLQQNGQIQSLTIAFFSSFHLIYLILSNPISSKFVFIKEIIQEATTIFNTITFLVYPNATVMHLTYDDQLLLGWIHISTFTFQLGLTFLIDLIQQISIIFNRITTTRNNNKQLHHQHHANSDFF